MFLSFIVPVYNTDKYLSECLNSMLEQNIPADDYEIICVNDGSTDKSLSILQTYAQVYSNIVVIDKENGGVTAARNAGLDAAKGDYIWFVDSDDFICSNILFRLKNSLLSGKYDRLIVGTYNFKLSLTDNELVLIHGNQLRVNSHFHDSVVWGSLLRRDFLLRNNCRFHYPEITHGEDSLFMYEFMSHLPVCFEIDEPVYFNRTRPESAQNSREPVIKHKQLMSYFKISQIMQRHYHEARPGNKKIAANMLMTYLWYTLHGASKAKYNTRALILKSLKKLELYPCNRPTECTLKRSFQTTRTDIVGKVFDKVYINMHRPWGFWSMFFLERLIRIKSYVQKLLKGVKA